MARYPIYSPRRKSRKGLFVLLVLVAAGAAAGWAIYARSEGEAPDDPPSGEVAKNGNAATQPAAVPPGTTEQRGLAIRDYDKGMKLKAADDIIKARAALSEAVLSGHLPRKEEDKAVAELTDMANRMIFSRRVYDGDSYTYQYTFRDRDVLSRVVRNLKLYISWQGVLLINQLANPRRIRAGQVIKVVKGPFHAIVYKSRHIMDLYLHRGDMERVFVRRVPVGLGRDGITPVGSWKVKDRLKEAAYYPAANSPLKKRRINYGEADYAFGHKGLWLGLAGIDADTIGKIGYGLHSTTDQSSIGKDASEGCIRLADDDIQLVFDLFYEQRTSDMNSSGPVRWSTVHVRP